MDGEGICSGTGGGAGGATVVRESSWREVVGLEPAVRGFLERRCRDESELDDVVQETLLRAARYRESLHDPRRLRSWTLRIAVNALRDHVRRELRLQRGDVGDEVLDLLEGREAPPGIDDEAARLRFGRLVLEREDAFELLSSALARLADDDVRVLDAYYRLGLSCGAIAHLWTLTPEVVKARLFRARRRLSQVLEGRFVAAAL